MAQTLGVLGQVGRDNVLAGVASTATDDFVFAVEWKTNGCMIERSRVEANDFEVPPVMLTVTFRAMPRHDGCMITLVIVDARGNFFMTVKTL